jgi:hypothetical protein
LGGSLGGFEVSALALDSSRDILYVGCNPWAVISNPDRGGLWRCGSPFTSPSWKRLNTPGGLGVSQIALDSSRDVLYSGCSKYVVEGNSWRLEPAGRYRCKSPDGSPSWQIMGEEARYQFCEALAYDRVRNTLYAQGPSNIEYCPTPEKSSAWFSTVEQAFGGGGGGLIIDRECENLFASI